MQLLFQQIQFLFVFLEPPSYIILISLILLLSEGTKRISMEPNLHFDEFSLTAVTQIM